MIRTDVGPVLSDLRKITSVEVKIAADEARQLVLDDFFQGESDPLGALIAAQRAQQGGIITVGWSVGQGSDADQGFFRQLLYRLRGADLSRFRSVKAKVRVAHSDSLFPVDFLNDRIAAEVDVDPPAGRQRLVAPPVALEAMQRAWSQFQNTDKVLDRVNPVVGSPFRIPPSLTANVMP